MIRINLCNHKTPDWQATVVDLYDQLDFPNNPALLPPQFVQVTFPKIGGKLIIVHNNDQIVGASFLMPRGYEAGIKTYTLRYHPIVDDGIDQTALIAQIKSHLPQTEIVLFDPLAPRTYATETTATNTAANARGDGTSIVHPTADEATEIRSVHQQIWHSPPGYLYPAEMHCIEYGAGTSLVARAQDRPRGEQIAGFVLGFYRFGGSKLPADWHDRFNGAWRLESQSMGVLPTFRGQRLAHRLKQKQAELAHDEKIHLIHWTFDPLQFPNAALNIGLLRGVAFDFHADLYPFRNALNQVAASRFSITWLSNTDRCRPRQNQRVQIVDLKNATDVVRLNDGPTRLVQETEAEQIAIEIPADWQSIQTESVPLAQRWREATDAIFEQFIGCEPDQYTVTDVAVEGNRRYLLATRSTEVLWEKLGAQTFT